jgi:hypothetical protein
VSQYKLVALRGGKKVISTATAAGGADKVGLDIRQCMRARVLFDSSANRSIVLAFVNTWGFDMDDVKAVIEQATDAVGTPPEAPKPEVKKVGQAAKKAVRKVGPKKVGKKAKTSAKKSAKKTSKKAKAMKKKAKKAKR